MFLNVFEILETKILLAGLRFSNIRKLNQTKHVESGLEHMQHVGSIPTESTKIKELKIKVPFSYASNSSSSKSFLNESPSSELSVSSVVNSEIPLKISVVFFLLNL